MLLIGLFLVLFGGLLLWLAGGRNGPPTKPTTGAAPAQMAARPPASEQDGADTRPADSDVVTEMPRDDEFKAVQEVTVNKTHLHIGDPFDYVSSLFKSENRLGQPVIVADPNIPGSIVVTHVYVNYDRTILKVQAKRKTRRGPFLICGLWIAPARK